MKPRATAVVLALVLLGASVSARRGACCPPAGETAPMVRAIDCCATEVACASRPPAALATARPAGLAGMEPLAVVPAAMSHPFLTPSAAAVSLSAPREQPPFQRIPAPLRI